MNAAWTRLLAWLAGHGDLSNIDSVRLHWNAVWAERYPAAVWLASVAALLTAVYFYRRWQPANRVRAGRLAILRGVALMLLVVIMADPVLEMRSAREEKPLLWLLVDASESMNLAATTNDSPNAPTRADEWNQRIAKDARLREQLSERFRVEAFTFAGIDHVRSVEWNAPLAINADSETNATAIGSALAELRRRNGTRDLAGVVIVSDFVQNAGPPALESAGRLDVPIFAVGVGPEAAVDLAVELDAESIIKKDERAMIAATIRQSGLTGKAVTLRLASRPADGQGSSAIRSLGEQRVTLNKGRTRIEFPITPEAAGRFQLRLNAEVAAGEALSENNHAEQILTVTDDFLRVLFVEYEPTWEWRFIKEVFHRDRLVGRGGFRTYLRSSDPAVRETNELFIPSLPPPREEFFQYDVIFIGDVPASALPGRFAEMTHEFVSEFGGGLVMMAGPRFGPQALAGTPIADMLPVIIDPDAPRRDEPFRLVLTSAAEQFDFMQLGDSPEEHARAWNNLGELPWYQPVQRVEGTSVVLAEHPTDTTSDGRTKQPLIARRQYGAAGGEVVYLGFNETWRLRRLHGDTYYRQFWAQLIHRLGLSHARGADKRFVVEPLPEEPFAPGEEVPLVVRAWDAKFQKLTEEDLPEGQLVGELVLLEAGTDQTRPVSLTMTRPGVFEANVPVAKSGDWRFRVLDPVTKRETEVPFEVADPSRERRVPDRDSTLQQQLAGLRPGGRACQTENLASILAGFHPPKQIETTITSRPLSPTWLTFALIVGVLLCEWSLRKWWNLA